MTKTVLVVGGGAFGLSSALSLQKRGYQVTVFDRLPIPAIDAASSDISKVIRPDYFTQPLYQHLALDALSIFKNQWNPDAKKRLGTDLYIESGSLLTFSDPTDPKDVNHQAEELQASGVETNMVGVEDIQDMMGESFAKTFHTGFSNPMSGYAYASKTMKYLAEIAGEAGVVFVAGPKEGAFAEYLMEEDQVVGIITADGVKHYGDIVLMAAGSWTPSLVPQLEGLCVPSAHPVALIQLPVELQQKYSQIPIWFADITKTGFYGFPCVDGILKIGYHSKGYKSTFHKDTKPRVSSDSYNQGIRITPFVWPDDAKSRFQDFIRSVFPDLVGLEITTTRMCWYCESRDGNFLIDAVPNQKNVFVASGDSGHGFKFVPVIGDVIADIIEGKNTPLRELFKWRIPPRVDFESALADPTELRFRTEHEQKTWFYDK